MAKVRSPIGERSRRWGHVTESSESFLADVPTLRESAEELRALSAEILKLENQQVHPLAEAQILTAPSSARGNAGNAPGRGSWSRDLRGQRVRDQRRMGAARHGSLRPRHGT
jgi:hypothetical protein